MKKSRWYRFGKVMNGRVDFLQPAKSSNWRVFIDLGTPLYLSKFKER